MSSRRFGVCGIKMGHIIVNAYLEGKKKGEEVKVLVNTGAKG